MKNRKKLSEVKIMIETLGQMIAKIQTENRASDKLLSLEVYYNGIPEKMLLREYFIKVFGSIGYYLFHFNGTKIENDIANELWGVELRRCADMLRTTLHWQHVKNGWRFDLYFGLEEFLYPFLTSDREGKNIRLKYAGEEITNIGLLPEINALL